MARKCQCYDATKRDRSSGGVRRWNWLVKVKCINENHSPCDNEVQEENNRESFMCHIINDAVSNRVAICAVSCHLDDIELWKPIAKAGDDIVMAAI